MVEVGIEGSWAATASTQLATRRQSPPPSAAEGGERLHAEACRDVVLEEDVGHVVVRLIVLHPVDTAAVVRRGQCLQDRSIPLVPILREIEVLEKGPIPMVDAKGRVRAGRFHGAPIRAPGRAPLGVVFLLSCQFPLT